MDPTTEMNVTSEISGNNDSHCNSYEEFIHQFNNNDRFRDFMINFASFYEPKHVYVSYTICIFGMIANVINVMVLTRKNMQTAVNAILTALAVSNFVLLVSYQGNNLSFNFLSTYPWAVVRIALMNSYKVSYAISVWLPVVVAIWRFMHVCHPSSTKKWRNVSRARIAIISTYAACILLCSPYYLIHIIDSIEANGCIVYYVGVSEIFYNNYSLFYNMETWFLNIILRILPCFPLFVLIVMLIMTICRENKNRSRQNFRSKQDKSHERTTKMLIVIMVFLFLVNFLRGLVYVLYKLKVGGNSQVYVNTYKTMESLALLNSSVNFILYFCMSIEFRETLAALILKPWKMLKKLTCTRSTGS